MDLSAFEATALGILSQQQKANSGGTTSRVKTVAGLFVCFVFSKDQTKAHKRWLEGWLSSSCGEHRFGSQH